MAVKATEVGEEFAAFIIAANMIAKLEVGQYISLVNQHKAIMVDRLELTPSIRPSEARRLLCCPTHHNNSQHCSSKQLTERVFPAPNNALQGAIESWSKIGLINQFTFGLRPKMYNAKLPKCSVQKLNFHRSGVQG